MSNLPSKNSTSTSLSIAPDRALLDLVAIYRNRLEQDGQEFSIAVMPTPQDRSAMETRQADLHRALRPVSMAQADREKAAVIISGMLSAWIHTGRGDPKGTVSAYLAHLQDMPLFAIEKACRAVSRGYVDGLSPDFPPSAARLHQLAVDACEDLCREQSDIRKVLSAKQHHIASAEERARMAENFRALAESLKMATTDPAEENRRAHAIRRSQEASTRGLLAEYARIGIEPLYCGDVLISPALLKQLRLLPVPVKQEAAE